MPQVAYHPLGGLEDLELGLRSLLQSQLMAIPAFQDMYRAIERHHRDVKLAHLTGKPRDLQVKAVKDTKFYNILMKMLCEVAGKQARDQTQGLQQVHTWYLTNTHVLLCGPHFGKQYKQDKAKEILRRATTAKQPVHFKSALGQELSPDIASCRPDRLSADDFQDLLQAWEDPASSAGPAEDSDIDQSLGSLQLDHELPVDHEPCARAATNSPELGDLTNIDQFTSRSGASSPGQDVTSTEDLCVPEDEPATVSPPRVLMRPKTAISVQLSLRKQSDNLSQAVTDIRNMVHPIASLVNPHSTVPRQLSNVETDPLERRPDVGRRALSAKPSRSQSLQAWQTFNKKRSYGQDVVNKLNFIGRSGTGLCIRYSAHDLGESPEAHTHDFLKLYANHTRSSSNHAGAEGNMFAHQSLEDFYQTVEDMNASSSNSHRTSHMTRAKSAPAVDKTRTSREAPAPGSKQTRPTSTTDIHLEPHQDNRCEHQQVVPAHSDTGVSLDRVISVIDAVTDSMAYYKEKLAPEPQLGFRQPSTTGLLSSRELVSSCSNDVSMDSVYGMSAGIHQPENITTRPFSSTLAYGTAVRRDDMPEKHKETKIRCVSAGVVDWRGRITPESVRYKWSRTRCGGLTYVKRWYQPKSGTAGGTSAGRRPKTAPMTPRKRWRAETDSGRDGRAVQATSHRAAVVDPADVQSMMQVKPLLASEHRTDKADSISIDGLTWRTLITRPTQLPAMEYLSFVAPSVTTEQQSEKSASYRDKAEGRAQAGQGSCVNIWEQAANVEVNIHLPHHHFDEDALNVAVSEELGSPRRNHSLQPAGSEAQVERSAGRMPGQSHSATFGDQRHRSANIEVPPLCTPASIPNPRVNFDTSKPRHGQLLFELERHARRTTSPADCMNKVEALRSSRCVQRPAVARSGTTDSIVGTSLHISRLPVTSRDQARMTTSARHNADLKQLGECRPDTGPQHLATSLRPQSSPGPRSITKIGRPVAELFQTPDPDDLLQAVQLRRQAAAAVDIQRIFRGYVARNMYKSLLSEERHKREDARRAAVRIQRMYRSHLLRKRAIYNRPPLDPEVVQWSQDVKELQSEHLAQRQAKLASWTNELNSSHRQTTQRLAVIGPHVEVYSAYHPKRVGPTRHQLHVAAVNIQKMVRGWLLRRKLEKLSRKAACHGSSFQKLARNYKAMLKRVQQQHGVGRPKMPFSIQCFSEYMDLRRRYEGIFENKCFEGELDPASLPAFFRECGLCPSQSEIEQALDVTLQGNARQMQDRGLTKREVLGMIFYIYVPPAAGLESTRRSTWMNPIIDGQEARQLLGSQCVEAAPLAPCMQLVIEAKQAQRQREQDHKEEVKRKRIVEAELRTEDKNEASDVVKVDTDENIDEDKQTSRKSKTVTLHETDNVYH